jgi:hypothetical protein
MKTLIAAWPFAFVVAVCITWAQVGLHIGYDRGYADGYQRGAADFADPKPDPPALSKIESAIWYRYFTAELNVRYRERLGDDGLQTLWAEQRERCAAAWEIDDPSPAVADALYRQQVHISSQEGPEVDAAAIREIQDEIEADMERGTFPPDPSQSPKDHEPEALRPLLFPNAVAQ